LGQKGEVLDQIGKSGVLRYGKIDLKNHGGAVKTALIMKGLPDKFNLGGKGFVHRVILIRREKGNKPGAGAKAYIFV
jgi:hypothetical protein